MQWKHGISGIVNCDTFSVAPSTTNDNVKKRAVPGNTKGVPLTSCLTGLESAV